MVNGQLTGSTLAPMAVDRLYSCQSIAAKELKSITRCLEAMQEDRNGHVMKEGICFQMLAGVAAADTFNQA